MNSLLRLTLSTALILAAGFMAKAADVTPNGAQITGVRLSGDGCTQAEAAVSLSPDAQDLSIIFDNFIFQSDAHRVDSRTLRQEKRCQVLVDVQIPRGWTFALKSVDYRGFADAPAGATTYQQLLFSAPGMPVVSVREATFRGPYSNNYTFSAVQKPGRYAWSTCGLTKTTLNMTSVIGVAYARRSVYPDSMISLDSQDNSIKQSVGVIWQKCQ